MDARRVDPRGEIATIEITRFPSSRHLVGYLGLDPRVRLSGSARGARAAVAAASLDRWPLAPGQRSKWGRELPPALHLPEQFGDRHLLTDHAEWDAGAWDMHRELLPLLADTLQLLCDRLPHGFVLRATWSGSEVRDERQPSCGELVRLTLDSQLNEFTRYRVSSAEEAATPT